MPETTEVKDLALGILRRWARDPGNMNWTGLLQRVGKIVDHTPGDRLTMDSARAALDEFEARQQPPKQNEFEYIRRYYGIAVGRGTRVRYAGRDGSVTSAKPEHYLNVRFDGDKSPKGPFHPKDLEYLGQAAVVPAPQPQAEAANDIETMAGEAIPSDGRTSWPQNAKPGEVVDAEVK